MRVLGFEDLKPEKGIKFSRQHIHRLVKAGRFPRPIKVGLAKNGWVEAELDGWIEARMKERDAVASAA